MENHLITSLAYADDVLLLAESEADLQLLISTFDNLISQLGMHIAIDKTNVFHVCAYKRSWISKPISVYIQDTLLNQIGIADPFTYLGVQYVLEKGSENQFHLDEVNNVVNRLSMLELKPRQKMKLLHTYLLPKFYYVWVASLLSQTFLMKVDTLIRRFLKRWLHLPLSVTDALFYTAKKWRTGLSKTI